MSEEQPAEQQSEEQQSTEAPQEGEPKTFDESYVKKLRDEAAKYRTDAKANAEAAKKLKEIEDANKSEVEKAAARLAEVEQEAATAKREALRYRIATEHALSAEDAELIGSVADEDAMQKLAERLKTDRESDSANSGAIVPGAGRAPKKTGGTTADQFAAVITQQLS